MPPWADQQRDFAAALLDPARPVPDGITGPAGEACPKRFAVYRNNVVAGLAEILSAAYPAVRRLVGQEFFSAMAEIYVRAEPPRSPVLLDYGGGFPNFMARFPPAAGVPYLADVGRIEWAWVQAYHAPDADYLTAEDFAPIPPRALADLRMRLHPSVRICRSAMPALTIWRVNSGDGDPADVIFDGVGEDSLIARPQAMVEVRSLPPGAAAFIEALHAEATVAEATAIAAASDPRFDLAANIAGLIEAGALSSCQVSNIDEQDME